MSPEDLGFLRGFSIITGYAIFLNLGLFESLHRLYPYYIGRGRRETALAHAEIGQAWIAAMTAAVSGAFVIMALSALFRGNWRAGLGWCVQAVAVISINYGGFLSATYRSGQDFKTLAKSSVISSIVNFAILPLFLIWPYIALVLRSILGSLSSLIYLHIRRPLHLSWRFNLREWYYLVRQGMPIFIASYGASSLWYTIEMTMILHYLGASSLGLWTMSIIIFQAMKMIPESINAVYYPRIYELFGRTGKRTDLWRLIRRPMLFGATGMLFVTAIAWVTLPFVVQYLMPRYIAAISIMKIMMTTLPLVVLELPYAFFVASGKTVQQNVIVYASMSCFVVFALLAATQGLGLSGMVGASALGRLARVSLIYGSLSKTEQANENSKGD